MPNICVRSEENSCSVSSSSFTPSDAGSSEVLDSRNVFLELHYVGLENGKLLAPNEDWLRFFCETQLLSPGKIKGSLQVWEKKKPKITTTAQVWTKQAESWRRWLINASHRLIYERSLLTGDNIREPVEPDRAGHISLHKTREEKTCCATQLFLQFPNVHSEWQGLHCLKP